MHTARIMTHDSYAGLLNSAFGFQFHSSCLITDYKITGLLSMVQVYDMK